MQKYYKMLEVPYDAPLPDIKQAYRDLVRIWHPDRYVRDERLQQRATRKLMEINEAYRNLCSLLRDQDIELHQKQENAEPIDWARPAAAAPASENHMYTTSRDDVKHRYSLHWHCAAAALCVLAALFVLRVGSTLGEGYYSAAPFPPPVRESSNSLELDFAATIRADSGGDSLISAQTCAAPSDSITEKETTLP